MAFSIRPRVRRAFRLALRRRDLTDREIDEELRFHIELRVAQLVARGMTREQAEREARLRFGEEWDAAVARIHEAGYQREERLDVRERWDALRRDVSYAIRTLGRQPGFAAMVVITFALGIGANAMMFGVIDRLLLRPPPHVQNPEEVALVGMTYHYRGEEHFGGGLTYPFFTALRDDTAYVQSAIVSDVGTYTLGRGSEAQAVTGALVNADYFTMLGTRPVLGRFFGPSEDVESGNSGVVVLSYGFWQRQFVRTTAVLGQRVRIGPGEYTVVGVAPKGFTGPEPRSIDVWIPIASAEGLRIAEREWETTWDSFWIAIYVRLRPGVDIAVASARAKALWTTKRGEWLESRGRLRATDTPPIGMRSVLPAERLARTSEARISFLLAAVAVLVLAIACANVANLLLARGVDRRREIAIRLALGVSRRRLVRLLLAETATLAILGGVVALAAAVWGVRLIHATLLADFAWLESALNARFIAATALLVVTTVVVAGLAPALSASRPNVTDSLKAGGREGSVRHMRTRNFLLMLQAALSVLLLVGAGLFVRSMQKAATQKLGYEVDHVIAATVDLQGLGYKEQERMALFAAMRDRVATLPGVERVTISATHPLSGSAYGMGITVPGRDSLPVAETGGPYFNGVAGDYFSTLGLRIVDGRPLTRADIDSKAKVAVLSESMARAYWPGESAVGRCVMLGSDSTCTTVVGVAEDAKEQLRPGPPRFLIYTRPSVGWDTGESILLARARGGDPEVLVGPIRRAMQSVAPNLPFVEVKTFDELLAPQTRSWRMGATLFALFGGLALVIAAVGLYSVIAYSVSQRGHEFGVRMALGAQVRDIVRLVMGQGVRAAVAGVAVGSLGALVAGRLVADLLFETSPRNPLVFASVAALILAIAVIATLVPAWRAGRVDPVRALKGD